MLFSLNTDFIGFTQDQAKPVACEKSVDINITIEDFERRFRSLQKEILHQLKKNNVDTLAVINSLTLLPMKLKNEYEKAIQELLPSFFNKELQGIDMLFSYLNLLLSFLDYGLLEHIINEYGNNTLKQDMTTYSSDIVTFMKETTIKQLIESDHFFGQPDIPPNFSLLKARIGQDASKCTVEHLNRLRKKYCSKVQLSKIVCHLVAVVESNSFIVRWLVPSALVPDIVKSTRFVDQSFYQEFRITSLTLDGMWLYMRESEIDAMWSQLHMSDTKFKDQFCTMCKQIVCEIKVQNVSKDRLSLYFQSLNYQQQVSDQLSLTLLEEEFPASFVDFRVLKDVIEWFGSNCLKGVMRSYCNYMSIFMKESTAQQLINIGSMSAIQSTDFKYFKIAQCKIMKEPSNYKLDKLLSFRSRFCTITNYSEVCFIMDGVNTERNGSFTVRWLVSTSLISDTMKSSRNNHILYYVFKITSLTLDGMWLYLSESEIDAMWSYAMWSQLTMYVSDTKFKKQFCTMCKQIMCEMKIQNVSENHLLLFFQSLKFQKQISNQLSLAILEEEFPASFVNFGILKAVIEEFGSDCLKRVMRSYCNYRSFIEETTAQRLISIGNMTAIQSTDFKHSKLICRIMEEPSNYKLKNIFSFRTKLCTIADFNELCFVMNEVTTEMSGSFTVSWLVPPAFISDIMKLSRNFDRSLYHSYNVTSLTLDGMWLFLNKSEIDVMWSQVHISHTKLKDQFCTMCKQIVCEMKAQSVSKDHLSLFFQSLNYQQQISDQLSLALLEEEFPASFVDFGILKAVIETFGSDCLKRVMRSYYRNYKSIFTKQSSVQQLINLSVFQSKHWKHFVAVKFTIMEEPSHCRLKKILQFQTRFCAIASFNEVCFIMGEFNMEICGSFTVSWLVPRALIIDIMKSVRNLNQSFYQEKKIASLTLDGMWLHMSEAELTEMWIHMSSAKLVYLFQIMHKQIVHELKLQNTPIDELSQCLMNQHPNLQKNTSIFFSEAMLTFHFPPSGSFLDFDMLSITIKEFGSDCLRDVMMSYCKFISGFVKQLTVQQLLDLLPNPTKHHEGFIEAECGMMEEPSGNTCDRILSIGNSICAEIDCSRFMLTMNHVRKPLNDSFYISWLIPTQFASELIESANRIDSAFYIRKSIASMSVGNYWVYHQKLIPFSLELKEKYQQSQGSPSPVEWIPSPTRKIFRLAMIQRERVQQGHIEDSFVRMTISGRVDDILHAKSPVELEHIFRNTLHGGEIILIEGAPGSGKSTLTVHICQGWSKGELFQQFTIVILVQLRDPAVQRAQTIADLLPIENAEEIATELMATNGRGALWVLDGWDELPPRLQQDSIFYQLIKRMLSECSVIVTSRPISSGDLHPVVSSRIEVLGFTPEEQRQYFTECFKGDTKALEALLEKIQENPVVQSICYLPLNAAFIVHTFKYRGQSLPNTEYKIYLSVILSCIQRHYDREGRGRGRDLPRELASLDDVSRSEAVREPFQCLCELAYRGVMENKVTFSSSDLPQGSNTLSLLQAIESFLQSGKSVFYNFLHLSVQEVLSAYYLTTRLSDSEQVSQFQQLFDQPRFAAVFQFYAAITKLKSPEIHQVIDRIVEAKSKPLLVSLLRCLHEAQDPDLCLYVAERLEYRVDLSKTSLNPMDCVSVGFFLSSIAGKEISVNLVQCLIDDLGAKCLTKYLSMNSNTDLVTINLKSNDIHDEGASHVAKMLFYIKRLHLDVSGNPIGVTGTSHLFQAVRETTTLKTLILIGGTIVDDLLPAENSQEIAAGLRPTNGHGVLWIFDNHKPHIYSVPQHNSNTECSIIVTSRHTIDKIFKDKSKPLLVSLLRCLHEAQDPALCLYVAERLRYRLDLKVTSLSPLDCHSISFFLFSLSGKEIHIDLNRCTIGDRGAKCLLKYADDNLDYISKITIDLGGNKIHEEGALHNIARMLYFIEHLYLSHNPIGDTGASLISKAVRETATLKTLILSSCGITLRGAEDLSRALAQNRSLEKLDISWNSLGDEGISYMAEALKQNKQLKELWIGECGMTDKGAASLASALTINNSLKMLHMGGDKGALTEDGVSVIVCVLADSLPNKSLFVKLAIPTSFGHAVKRLSEEVNETRKRNGLPLIEIDGEYTVHFVEVMCHTKLQCFYTCYLIVKVNNFFS